MEIDKEKLETIIEKYENGEFKPLVGAYHVPPDNMIKELKALINPKWEPKELEESYTLDSAGILLKLTQSYESNRLYGSQWPTKELAETARDMNKRNQLILQAKTEMGYGDGNYDIKMDAGCKVWTAYCSIEYAENPELTFEYRHQADEVIKMTGLNDG